MVSTRNARSESFGGSSRVAGRGSVSCAAARRSLVVLLSAACVVAGGLASSAAAVTPNPPAVGLSQFIIGETDKPFDPPLFHGRTQFFQQVQTGAVDSAFATGQSDAKRAKVAIRLPTALTAVNLVQAHTNIPVFSRTGRLTGVVDGLRSYQGFVYLKSPRGRTPAFGLLPAVTINTLAFGILPARVTLQLSQTREHVTPQNPGGTPVPLRTVVVQDVRNNLNIIYDTTVTGLLELTVTDLFVDGRRVDVGSSCRTVTPTTMSLVGKQATEIPPPGFYSPSFGGDLYGTLSVPAFSGCRAAGGDDLSPVFTNALSGNDTAVHLFQGSLGQGQVDCSLRESTGGDLTCMQATPLPFPTGADQVPSIPSDWTPNLPPAPLPLLPPPSPAPTVPGSP